MKTGGPREILTEGQRCEQDGNQLREQIRSTHEEAGVKADPRGKYKALPQEHVCPTGKKIVNKKSGTRSY